MMSGLLINLKKCSKKSKEKEYHSVRKITNSNIKIIERRTNDTPNTQIHDRSLSCLGTEDVSKQPIQLVSTLQAISNCIIVLLFT